LQVARRSLEPTQANRIFTGMTQNIFDKYLRKFIKCEGVSEHRSAGKQRSSTFVLSSANFGTLQPEAVILAQ
jgi:hypothetical protein